MSFFLFHLFEIFLKIGLKNREEMQVRFTYLCEYENARIGGAVLSFKCLEVRVGRAGAQDWP